MSDPMSSKINSDLITDDMLYEDVIKNTHSWTPIDRIIEDKLWFDIRRAAKTDPVLQEALDRAIIVYQLSKEKYGTK